MLKLTCKCLALLLLLAVTVGAFALLLRVDRAEHLKPSDMYFCNEFRRVYSGDGAADIIVIGNSKALSSLSSGMIQEKTGRITYNLGYSSSSLTTSKLVLDTYLGHAKRLPRLCILEVSWFSFNTKRTIFHPEVASALLFRTVEPLKYLFRYPELLRLSGKMIIDDAAASFSGSGDGAARYVDYRSRPHAAIPFDRKEMEKTFPGCKAGIDADLLGDLADIVKTCQRHNIRLILYTAPEMPEYTRSQLDREVVKAEILRLAGMYHLTYLDFTIDGNYWRNEYTSHFVDSHHLSTPDRFTDDFLSALASAGIMG